MCLLRLIFCFKLVNEAFLFCQLLAEDMAGEQKYTLPISQAFYSTEIAKTAKYKYASNNKKNTTKITLLENRVGYASSSLQNVNKYQLSDLPTEILIMIASFLNIKCVLNVGQTCKRLYDVMNSNILWRNLYERDFFGSVYEVHYILNNWKKIYKCALYCDCVFILNNLDSCSEDVNKIQNTFLHLGYRIILYHKKNHSNVTLKSEICKHKICPSASLLVFFFGYGFNNNIFIGSNCCITYRKFCEIFCHGRRIYSTLMLFTNTFFSTSHPSLIDEIQYVTDSFCHFWIKVNVNFQTVATDVILELFQKKGLEDTNNKFKMQIWKKLQELESMYFTNYDIQHIQKLRVTILEAPTWWPS